MQLPLHSFISFAGNVIYLSFIAVFHLLLLFIVKLYLKYFYR